MNRWPAAAATSMGIVFLRGLRGVFFSLVPYFGCPWTFAWGDQRNRCRPDAFPVVCGQLGRVWGPAPDQVVAGEMAVSIPPRGQFLF